MAMTPTRLAASLCAVALAAAMAAQVPATVPAPAQPRENPTTPDKVQLGKALFWDEQLSSNGTVACGTCHLMAAGGGDPRAPSSLHPGVDGRFGTADDVHGSPGVTLHGADGLLRHGGAFPLRPQVTGRKAPTVLMAAFYNSQFWDGRAEPFHTDGNGALLVAYDGSLEAQSAGPPVSEVEMSHIGSTWADVAARITTATPLALATSIPRSLAGWLRGDDYPMLFQRAFGTPVVTPARIQFALAAYQRTLIPDRAPIDAFLAGDHDALTQQELLGFAVFAETARCGLCHSAPLFFRQDFFNVGLRPWQEDTGRFAVSQDIRDRGAFKVPTLRNLEQRAPYFHDGSKATLDDVVDFYSRGGDFHEHQTNLVQPFSLTTVERAALLAFLQRPLTDPRVAAGQPPFDHPGLWSHGPHVPLRYGAGGGTTRPRLLADEPPHLGNGNFTLGIDRGPPSGQALLAIDVAPGAGEFLGAPVNVGATPAMQMVYLGLLTDDGQGAGWTSVHLAIPLDPALRGAAIFVQGVLVDGAFRLSTTNGVAFELFAAR